jgi:hypothetical protein
VLLLWRLWLLLRRRLWHDWAAISHQKIKVPIKLILGIITRQELQQLGGEGGGSGGAGAAKMAGGGGGIRGGLSSVGGVGKPCSRCRPSTNAWLRPIGPLLSLPRRVCWRATRQQAAAAAAARRTPCRQ